MKKNNYFYYDKKYKNISEKIVNLNIRFKQFIFSLISNILFLNKKLSFIDQYYKYTDKNEPKLYNNLYIKDFKLHSDLNLKKINLSFISFFEVIEIDKFDDFKAKLISKFSSKHSSFSDNIRYREDLIKKLSDIKISLETFSSGKLISINYKKSNSKKTNLIDRLDIDFIKKYESYFILHFKIKPSSKFYDIITQIKNHNDTTLIVRHYNSLKNIIKYRVFNSHSTFVESLTKRNIDNLISDLKYQVNQNFTKHLNGIFYPLRNDFELPSIEHYEIEEFKKVKEDKQLHSFINFVEIKQFTSEDELLDIYLENRSNKIYIIKEKGHGKIEQKPNSKDHIDYDRLESAFLIESLSFSCVFNAILNLELKKLNLIKRSMYDFFENSNKWNIFNYLFIFHNNNKYISLKKQITKLNLTTKRFKNEFNNRTIRFFSSYSDITKYNYSKENRIKEDINLLNYFTKDFAERIKILNEKTNDINDVFKNIEELNSYRTNYILQLVSLFLAVLAFIFAFDKVKDLLIKIFN